MSVKNQDRNQKNMSPIIKTSRSNKNCNLQDQSKKCLKVGGVPFNPQKPQFHHPISTQSAIISPMTEINSITSQQNRSKHKSQSIECPECGTEIEISEVFSSKLVVAEHESWKAKAIISTLSKIQQGDAQFVSHDVMSEWLSSWGTADERKSLQLGII